MYVRQGSGSVFDTRGMILRVAGYRLWRVRLSHGECIVNQREISCLLTGERRGRRTLLSVCANVTWPVGEVELNPRYNLQDHLVLLARYC